MQTEWQIDGRKLSLLRASVAEHGASHHLRLVTLRVTVLRVVTRQHHSGVQHGIFGLSATSGARAQ